MYPSQHLKICSILLFLSQAAWLVAAQRQTFDFNVPKEDADPTGESFLECSTIHFELKATENNTYDAVPPFYVISAEVGGAVTTDSLHGEEREGGTLIWDAVRHAPGGFVFTYVVDSLGNMGRIGRAGVVNGSTSNCRPSVAFSPLNMTLDKSQLLTCETLLINVAGGAKPYTVTVIGQPDRLVQNFTMGPEDDSFQFVNKNMPGENMMFMVSDSESNWSFATSFVTVVASTNVDSSCGGEESRSFQSNPNSATSPARGRNRAGAIAGGVIGGIALIVALILGLVLYRRRRRTVVKLGQGTQINLAKDEVAPLFRVDGVVTPFLVSNRQPERLSEKGQNPSNSDSLAANYDDRADPLTIGNPVYHAPTPSSQHLAHPAAIGHAAGDPSHSSSQIQDWNVEELYELPPEYKNRSSQR